MSRLECSRRTFLAGAMGGALSLTMPAYAWPGRPGLNGRFASGHIGLGARGAQLLTSDYLDPRVFCDVDTAQVSRAAPPARAGARSVQSYREVISSSEVDAIVIATPDHWHVPIARAACEAGKDVFIETPCTWMPSEAAGLLTAARSAGSIVQSGEMLPYTRAGVVLRERLTAQPGGTKVTAAISLPPNPMGGGFEFPPVPDGFDWKSWLGRAQPRPYNPDYAHIHWRFMQDWGGGHVRSIGTPMLATLLWAMGMESLTDAEVTATGTAPLSGIWDCPPEFEVRIRIGDRLEVSMRSDTTTLVPGMRIQSTGQEFELSGSGEDASLREADGAVLGSGWDDLPPLGHWAASMSSRTQPRLSLETSCAASTLTQLAVQSWRLKQTIQYDFSAGRTIGSDIADRLLTHPEWPTL